MTLPDLTTATDDDLAFMRSAHYRGGTDADLAAIDAEIEKRRRGDALRAAITQADLDQMEADCAGPLSDEAVATLERIRTRLHALTSEIP